MKNPTGRIVSVSAEPAQPEALVQIDSDVQCQRCRAGKGCGAGLFDSARQARRVKAVINDGLEVREGDQVRIDLAPAELLRASLLVYGTPLSGGVAGASLAFVIGLGELHAAATALVGIGIGIVVARRRLGKAACLREFTPTIVERLGAGS